jgi:nucleoside transporter
MKWNVWVRLAIMMFLQYAIWGAWAPVLYDYLTAAAPQGLGFEATQAAWIFGALWLACIFAPTIGGQIADRWVPTQIFLGVAHLAGAAMLYLSAEQHQFLPMLGLMVLYSILYAPTLALTNSLAFHHLRNAEREFGWVRVLGTLGWIVAGLALTAWRSGMLGISSMLQSGDSLRLAAVFSLVMGFFCFTLPHTPPQREGTNPFAFLEAIRLLRSSSFLVFLIISFVVTTELQFYYMPTPTFLSDIGVTKANVPAVMTVAQIAEVFAMALALPLLLPKLGIRKALAIGVIAWPLRYIIFAIGQPLGLVIGSLALHGIGYTFFFVVSQIYVDKVAPRDIRASAQALLTLVTLGLGNFLGTQFTGLILDWAKSGGKENWTAVFLVPCALTVACAIAFLIGFRDPRAEAGAEPDEQERAELETVEGGPAEGLA